MKKHTNLCCVKSILFFCLLLLGNLLTSVSSYGQDETRSLAQLPIDEVLPSVFPILAQDFCDTTDAFLDTGRLGTSFAIHPAGFLVSSAHVFAEKRFATMIVSENEPVPVVLISCIPQYDLVFFRTRDKMDLKPIPVSLDDPAFDMPYFLIGNYKFFTSNYQSHGLTVGRGHLARIERTKFDTELCVFSAFLLFDIPVDAGGSGSPVCDSRGNLQAISLTATGTHIKQCGAVPAQAIEKSCRENFNLQSLLGYTSGLDIETKKNGVYVSQVKPGSPAEKAEIKRNDRITFVGDWAVNNAVEFFFSEFAYVYDNKTIHLPMKIFPEGGDEERSLTLTLAPEKREKSEVDSNQLKQGCEFTVFADEGVTEPLAKGWTKSMNVHLPQKSHTQYEGYFNFPKDGSYCIYLNVDGTGKLAIDQSPFIEKSQAHPTMRVAKRAFFAKGYHSFKLELWTEKPSMEPFLYADTLEETSIIHERAKPLPNEWVHFLPGN